MSVIEELKNWLASEIGFYAKVDFVSRLIQCQDTLKKIEELEAREGEE